MKSLAKCPEMLADGAFCPVRVTERTSSAGNTLTLKFFYRARASLFIHGFKTRSTKNFVDNTKLFVVGCRALQLFASERKTKSRCPDEAHRDRQTQS